MTIDLLQWNNIVIHSSEWFIESARRRREKMLNFVSKNVFCLVKCFWGFWIQNLWRVYEEEFLVTLGFNIFILFCISYDFHISPGSSQSRVQKWASEELLIPCELNATNSMLYTFNPMRTHSQERGGSVFLLQHISFLVKSWRVGRVDHDESILRGVS